MAHLDAHLTVIAAAVGAVNAVTAVVDGCRRRYNYRCLHCLIDCIVCVLSINQSINQFNSNLAAREPDSK